MKRIKSISAMVLLAAGLLFTACSKSKDNNSSSGENGGGGSWTINGATYKATGVITYVRANAMLLDTDTMIQGNSMEVNFFFKKLPVTSGTYEITDRQTADVTDGAIGVQASDVVMLNGNPLSVNFDPAQNNGVKATVKVSGGKITVMIPDVPVVVGSYSGTFSCNVTETSREQ